MNERVAFITGATSGIGAAFARHFAKEGYDLIITGLPSDDGAASIEELKKKHHVNIEMLYAEFSNEDDMSKLEDIIKSNDKIEVLVNNAGFGFDQPFLQNKIGNIENMIKVHITAPVRFIYAALPNMIRGKKGTIINLSSLSSFMPVPKNSMYSATKLFNNSFMESLHISYRNKGIKVQVLCPGFVRTNFHAKNGTNQLEHKIKGILRWMQPDKVVEISIRNLIRKNKVIVVPGLRNRIVKFLFSILPQGLYYNLATKYLQ